MSIADLGSVTNLVFDSITTNALYLGVSGTPLTIYQEYSLTGNMTGPFTAPATVVIRQVGNTATLSLISDILGTSTVGTFMTFSVTIPVLPYTSLGFPVWVQTANTGTPTYAIGNCNISNTGTLTVSVGYSTSFPASGTVGAKAFTMCYSTN
jgi:hypothetical protein